VSHAVPFAITSQTARCRPTYICAADHLSPHHNARLVVATSSAEVILPEYARAQTHHLTASRISSASSDMQKSGCIFPNSRTSVIPFSVITSKLG
jgi:hypothetical protein